MMGLVNEAGQPIKTEPGISPLGNENAFDGTRFDKPPPTAPPDPVVRDVPEWFKPVYDWISSIVREEALILDLCVEECMKLVEFNFSRGAVGTDLFGDGQGGGGVNRGALLALASGLAPALYKEVLDAMTQKKEVFEKLIAEAKKRRVTASPDA